MPDTPPKIQPATPPAPKQKSYETKKDEKKDTPPKAPKRPSRPARQSAGRPPELERKLQEFFLNIALIVTPFNQIDGQIIAANSESMAKSWGELAKQNAGVKRALERMMEGGAWSGVIFSTGAVAFAIAQNHGVLPEFTFGIGTLDEPEEPPNA